MTKKFALIGLAGYIAPRHLKAIKEVGGDLVAALDIADSVGILDPYFPDCAFFTEESAFYDFLMDKEPVDYLVVCSPNHLHEEHCYAGLKLNTDVICEKPLTLTTESLAHLEEAQQYTRKHIYTILQLRLHPKLQQLKEATEASPQEVADVQIEYFTPRGKWYHASWKGDISKSGGIATNIGIHLFDLVVWLFGDVKEVQTEKQTPTESIGTIELQNARVRWHLSIEPDVPPKRQMIINGVMHEFTDGFADLHTASYRRILEGKGFDTSIVRPSIELVEKIRKAL
ncbi:MAG: Gfo/Idh/MocA family oxidoreductase [Sphingobacteriales bacterium]|nr:Gfo/Idh/MocA family oxidoreductase [Sphingobacteriales bacterium]